MMKPTVYSDVFVVSKQYPDREKTSYRFCVTSHTRLRKLLSKLYWSIFFKIYSLKFIHQERDFFYRQLFSVPCPSSLCQMRVFEGSYPNVRNLKCTTVVDDIYQPKYPRKESKRHIYLWKHHNGKAFSA